MMARQVVAAALFIAGLPAVVASQQNSGKDSLLVVEYFDEPASLEDATGRARAIVRARIIGARFHTQPHPEMPLPDVNTVYTLNVVDVLKQDPQLPVPIEVLRHGGDVETGQGIRRVVEEDFPPFEPGAQYLLFLYWDEDLGTYQISKGRAGAFRITPNNRLYGFGPGALAKQYSGQDPREVVSRIRQIVAARRDK